MNILDEAVDILCGSEPEADIKHYMTITTLFGLATVVNSVRPNVIVPTDGNKIPPNIYATNLAGSGMQKSRSLGYIEDLFIDEANKRLKEKVQAKIDRLPEWESGEISRLTEEGVRLSPIFKSATDSAVGAVRSIMDMMDTYCVNIALDEVGSVLLKEYELLSDTLLNAYDKGVLKANLRRTTGVKPTDKPVPHNLLMFGSPTLLFESNPQTEKAFMDLLQAGMARRSLFAVVETKVNNYTLTMNDEMKERIRRVSNTLVTIVDRYEGFNIEFSKEAKELYEKSENQFKEEASKFGHFEIIPSIYRQNKHWIALKISGLLAMLDLKNEIELSHYQQALDIVQNSEVHLGKVIRRPEKFELVVDYLLSDGKAQNEYTLTQSLPFYKEVKNKKSFWELAKGYSFENNITLMLEDRHNLTFYQAKAKQKTDLTKPLTFSYSTDMAKDYYSNDEFVWEDLHKVITSDRGICYSAHCYKDGHRTKDTAIEGFDLLILDIDENVSIDMAKLLFEEYTYLIATTRNHQKEKNGKIEDRFRIVLPMQYRLELDKEQYAKFMKSLMDDLPIEVDMACSDISRMYFSATAEHWYNKGDKLFDGSQYIPNTQEEEEYKKKGTQLAKKNINGISQYIIRNEANGRNNQLAKLSLLLMDNGYSHDECKEEIKRVNKQFQTPLAESELHRTVFKTIDRTEEIETDDDEFEEEDEFASVDK